MDLILPLSFCPLNAVLVQAGCKIVSGHVGGISCIRFTCDDKHVISIGKGDRAVLIWKVEKEQEEASLRSTGTLQ